MVKKTWNTLIALLLFSFKTTPFFRIFYFWKDHWWLLWLKRVHPLPENIWLNKVWNNSIKNANFWSFLSLKKPLAVTFNEMCAITSRKYVLEQGTNVRKFSEKQNFLWLHSSVFALHNNVKNANFWGFFPSINRIGDYSQWNACTHFQ